MIESSGAMWVWPRECACEPNQYVEFRQEFGLEDVQEAQLYISADSNYAVWINGEFINTGQYSDYPDDKSYDILPVQGPLKKGRNVLCVLAYWQGESASQYIKGDPGLIYRLKTGDVDIVSGKDTLWRKSQCYHSGRMSRITPQLGFNFTYDASGDDSWTTADYVPDGSWSSLGNNDIYSTDTRSIAKERPLPKLQIGDRVPSLIKTQGLFLKTSDDSQTIAGQMQNAYLSEHKPNRIFSSASGTALSSEQGIKIDPSCFDSERGVYLIIDIGREEAGLFEMEIETDAGVIVDIAYGEHLDDLRVRSSVGGRNFANRYICRDGRQAFTYYFTRHAGRYLQLHISGVNDRFILYYAGLRPTDYPVIRRGRFDSPVALQHAIYETSVRTLHLCMHEHYEDCPWREQSLYAMDSRNQALAGYYCFGEYEFPEVSFDLLGKGLKEDGYLELCAPAEIHITIPSFSMSWIMEVADHYMFSGDIEAARKQFPRVRKMMSAYTANIVDGLMKPPQGPRYWHFYEWADGLDGGMYGLGTVYNEDEDWDDAPLNLFLCLALDSAAFLANACGCAEEASLYSRYAERIRQVFHSRFWNEENQAYTTYAGEDVPWHYAELIQSLAILSGVCPDGVASDLRDRLTAKDDGIIETTLSHSIYKFEALLQEPEKHGKWVFNKIANDWGYMLEKGATSFWETIKGGDDFDYAGSLCHGWSGIPVYFYQAYLMGVRPVEPGFKRFTVAPMPDILHRASGVIPTPHGLIELSWEKVAGELKYDLNYPEETEPGLMV